MKMGRQTKIPMCLCGLLCLAPAAVSLRAQSAGVPGPLHQRTEAQELGDLTAAPDTINQKVANANSLVGLAVDPTNGKSEVVLSSSAFYVSSDGGSHWNTDFVPYFGVLLYSDDYTVTPDASQSAVGISYDRAGHTYVALQDPQGFNSFSGNQAAVAEGLQHGAYVGNVPALAAAPGCETPGFYCEEDLNTLGIVTDQSGTKSDGTTYVYYTILCNNLGPGCPTGDPLSEVLYVSGSTVLGQPSLGGLVSTFFQYVNVSGASGVVDSTGAAHFLYSDLGEQPTVDLVLDSAYAPLLKYTQVGFLYKQTGVLSTGPTCASHGQVAYCAFNAGHLGPGAPQAHGNIYLATVDLQAGTATAVLVNNDPPGKGKDHFNPAVTVTPNGDVYVGWFDDRRDPADKKLDYFLARSTDGGKTFPMQQPINDVSFSALQGAAPTATATNFAGFLGSGPDGVVHAAWTDTRDGTGVQVYSRSVQW